MPGDTAQDLVNQYPGNFKVVSLNEYVKGVDY
jgi:hypothetical protein